MTKRLGLERDGEGLAEVLVWTTVNAVVIAGFGITAAVLLVSHAGFSSKASMYLAFGAGLALWRSVRRNRLLTHRIAGASRAPADCAVEGRTKTIFRVIATTGVLCSIAMTLAITLAKTQRVGSVVTLAFIAGAFVVTAGAYVVSSVRLAVWQRNEDRELLRGAAVRGAGKLYCARDKT